MLNLARRRSDEELDLGLAGAAAEAPRSLGDAEDEIARLRQLLRVLGHELGNSLGPMKSLLGSARLMLGQGAAPRLDGLLATVEERAAHLQSFATDCVRSSQVAAPRRAPVDWQRLVSRLKVLFPCLAVDGVPPAGGACDAVQLEQVLINLVKNAHEAGSPAGEVRLAFAPAPGGLRIAVLDRGCGMTDVQLAALGRKGFTTKPGGSGIGLYLCCGIVERHGGRLTFSRREGGGTKVSIHLPNGALAVPVA